jgi:hypothetical protein
MVERTMIVRIHRTSILPRSQRLLRLQGVGLMALGLTALLLWNPLTQPGPIVCLLRQAVGLPCPLCGMTRGVSLCLRGRLTDAAWFNPLAGPALVLAVLLAGVWGIEFVGGRRCDVSVPPWLRRIGYRAFFLLLMANWIFLLVYRREDAFAATWLGRFWGMFAG